MHIAAGFFTVAVDSLFYGMANVVVFGLGVRMVLTLGVLPVLVLPDVRDPCAPVRAQERARIPTPDSGVD